MMMMIIMIMMMIMMIMMDDDIDVYNYDDDDALSNEMISRNTLYIVYRGIHCISTMIIIYHIP
jgi:hypothetical protein